MLRTSPCVDAGAGRSARLLGGLSETTPEVRGFAARSAGWTGLAAAWDELVVLLGDVEPDNRLKALRALERLDADATANLDALDTLAVMGNASEFERGVRRVWWRHAVSTLVGCDGELVLA